MNLAKVNLSAQAGKLNLPKSPGIYQFLGSKSKIIYIGKASDLRSRVLSYWQKSAVHAPAKQAMLKQIKKIKWVETNNQIEAMLLEANLIKKYQPDYNVLLRDDKRFIYIKISTEDDIPGVFATRKIDKAGKYFGPFTSTTAVRQTLKTIRKIWPYCTMRKKKAKPCFYYQINRCLGICTGLVSKKEYMDKVIKPITLFLQGKKERIIKNLEKEKKVLIKKGNKEAVARINFHIKNMNHVLEHTSIISLSEKYAVDVIELAKLLSLPKVPLRIEGYDISNIFGRQAVGSMVVFTQGEPDKQEYRKFKIKTDQGKANDVRMLKEVMERRFNNDWPLPDLIIVDGGRAQLNVALSVLKKIKLDPSTTLRTSIPVIAVSKGKGLRSAQAPDKLFFPDQKKPLELPLASPALHLIKRVRDEAHRFAISYHRLLRKKVSFKK